MTDRLLLAQISVDITALRKQMQKAGIAVDTSATRMEKRWNRSTQKMTRDTEQFGRDVRRAILAIGIGAAVNEVGQLADAWTEAANQIKAAALVSGQASVSLSKIADISRDTRTEFTATAALYARLSRATSELAVDQTTLLTATKLINQAFVAGGASAAEQESAILQLSQALSSGALQGDELRSIRESSPLILAAIAKEFGVATGALKELGAQGKLVSSRVFASILNAAPEIEAQFATTQSTIAQSLSNLRTSVTQYVGETDGALGASKLISGAINSLADNFDTFADALVIAVTLLGARGLGGALNSATIGAAKFFGGLAGRHNELISNLKAERREATKNARQALDNFRKEEAALAELNAQRAKQQKVVAAGPRLSEQYAKTVTASENLAAAERRLNAVLESGSASRRDIAKAEAAVQLARNEAAAAGTKQYVNVARLVDLDERHVVQTNRVSTAQKALAGAKLQAANAAKALANATNLATRAGGKLLAFFGGPIGLAVTAVGAAMAYFSHEAVASKRAIDALNTSLEYLSQANFDAADKSHLSEAASAALTSQLSKQKEATKALAEIERSRARINYTSGIKQAEEQIVRLQLKVKKDKEGTNLEKFLFGGKPTTATGQIPVDVNAQKELADTVEYVRLLKVGLEALDAVNFDVNTPDPKELAKIVTQSSAGPLIDADEAKKILEDIRDAWRDTFETETDIIKRTYTERLKAIDTLQVSQAKADELKLQAAQVYSAEIGKLNKEAEDDAKRVFAERKEAVQKEVEMIAQLRDARDAMFGRYISITNREYDARKASIEKQIADEVRREGEHRKLGEKEIQEDIRRAIDRNAGLKLLAEERAQFESQARADTKALDIRSDPTAEIELLRASEKQKMEFLEDSFNNQLVSEQEYADLRVEIARDTEAEIMAIRAASAQMQLSGAQSLFGGLAALAGAFAGESSAIYKGLFLTEKAFALASAYVQMNLAIAKAAASAPPPFNAPAILAAKITGIGTIAGIAAATVSGFKSGGYTGAGDPNEEAGVVHRGEYVFNAKQTKQLGVNNLKALAKGQVPRGGTIAAAVTGGGGGKSYSFGDTVISVSGNGAEEIRAELADTLAAHRRGIMTDIKRGFPTMARKERTRTTPRHERGRE